MIFYRAMNEQEMSNTIKNNRPSFNGRYKFFSNDLEFIINRVRDGKFAHSNFKNKPYEYILKFDIDNEENIRQLNEKEWMIDVRKIPLIKFNSINII